MSFQFLVSEKAFLGALRIQDHPLSGLFDERWLTFHCSHSLQLLIWLDNVSMLSGNGRIPASRKHGAAQYS